MPDGAARYAFAPAVLSIEAACHYLGQMSPTTFRAEVAIHIAPVRLSRGRIGWLRDDLDAWLDARAGRAAALPPANEWDAVL